MKNDPTNQCATLNREIKIKGLIEGHAVPTSLQPSCLDHYVMGGEKQWLYKKNAHNPQNTNKDAKE